MGGGNGGQFAGGGSSGALAGGASSGGSNFGGGAAQPSPFDSDLDDDVPF
jgi:single-strand DNA-binding protein